MPYAPKKPCTFPGCPNLTYNRTCEQHAGTAFASSSRLHDLTRPNAAARGYDSVWARFSKFFRSQNPLCGACEVRPVDDTHHIRALKSGGERLDPNNVVGLCRECHRCITAGQIGRDLESFVPAPTEATEQTKAAYIAELKRLLATK